MSKVVITTDTDTKEIMATVDGVEMPLNGAYVSKYTYKNYEGDEIMQYSVCLTQETKTGDMNTVITHSHDSHIEVEDMQETEATAALQTAGFKAFTTKLFPKLTFAHKLNTKTEVFKRFFR